MERSYSFVVPVFNRPNEVKELLESFLRMDFPYVYEIVIVEDGSTIDCKHIVENLETKLNISYFKKANTGPGDSRNFGMAHASGTYFIILDSDCLLPPKYLKSVESQLSKRFYHCFGGPDAAHENFTTLQKAINYVMTSFFTTGGIRGSENSVVRFEPRSFNMGISKEAFLKTGGFAKIHPGEDPDLSQRILKAGFETTYIADAFVYHKRRISWRKFYTQVKKFGLVRPILNSWHPKAAKIVFWFPTVFVLLVLASILAAIFLNTWYLLPLIIYLFVVFFNSAVLNRSISIGFLSVVALFVQFFGYGLAFAKSWFFIGFLKKDPEKQFPSLFFK